MTTNRTIHSNKYILLFIHSLWNVALLLGSVGSDVCDDRWWKKAVWFSPTKNISRDDDLESDHLHDDHPFSIFVFGSSEVTCSSRCLIHYGLYNIQTPLWSSERLLSWWRWCYNSSSLPSSVIIVQRVITSHLPMLFTSPATIHNTQTIVTSTLSFDFILWDPSLMMVTLLMITMKTPYSLFQIQLESAFSKFSFCFFSLFFPAAPHLIDCGVFRSLFSFLLKFLTDIWSLFIVMFCMKSHQLVKSSQVPWRHMRRICGGTDDERWRWRKEWEWLNGMERVGNSEGHYQILWSTLADPGVTS